MKWYDLYTEKKECCGCGACKDVCPVNAIDMVFDEEGFPYPEIDGEKCVDCGRCKNVCLVKNKKEKTKDKLYFGMQEKNEEIRASSSSGGMFSALAQYVFRCQGLVYGAAFNDIMEVVHMESDNMEELEKIKRTKYVQSSLEGIYQRIKKRLDEHRWVLFCGTPCQAQALRLFLRKDYPRLITVDLVCYGIPSPGIWKAYVKYLERKHAGKMTEFYFRDKRNRDNGHTCSYVIDGTEYVHPLYQDSYCRMYFRNYILRPSCYSCRFCTTKRESDFTIGDFWGIEQIRPDMDDGMGTSMVIVHSDKGKKIWDEIREEIRWFPCNEEDILQPRLKSPTGLSPGRKRFMALYRHLPFPWLLRWVRCKGFGLLK